MSQLARGTKIMWGDGGAAATAATLNIGSGATGVKFDAVTAGTAGNSITITMTNPGGTEALAVTVLGTAITIALGTTTGSIISTANDVIAGVFASSAARALVTASAVTTGLGVVSAASSTPLAGGTNSAETFADLPAIGDISFSPGTYSQLDRSSHSSTGANPEMINEAFSSPGSCSFTLDWDNTDAGHLALEDDFFSNTPRNCKLIPPAGGGKTYTFIAQCMKFDAPFPVKGVIGRDVQLSINSGIVRV